MDNRPIGIFDSGIGGLTVVREIVKILPHEKIIYIGDTARVPWGTRGKRPIINFSLQLANFLLKKNVKLIVVACHTASSVALLTLKSKIKIPVLGVILPAVREGAKKSKNQRIGIIGTVATIKSGVWEKTLKQINPKIKVFSVSCPLFVPLVEEGLTNHQATRILAKEYLQPLVRKKIDTLILACTHYPLLKKTIKEVVGNIFLINPGKEIAFWLKEFLKDAKLTGNTPNPEHQFYFTDISYHALGNWRRFAEEFKRGRIEEVNLI